MDLTGSFCCDFEFCCCVSQWDWVWGQGITKK